jgi:hypothetical protein
VTEPAIKSQPVYSPLQWDSSAAWHLLVAEGDGCVRLVELLAVAPQADFKVLAATSDAGLAAKLGKLAGPACQVVAGEDALMQALRAELGRSRMGLRLYLAGTDAFLWQSAREARTFGMSSDEMHLERCGSLERPVYCTHCTHVTQGVKTNLVVCPGCQRTLFVRDHFSRHLAAYMGFQIDAEVPGVVPPVEQVYP